MSIKFYYYDILYSSNFNMKETHIKTKEYDKTFQKIKLFLIISSFAPLNYPLFMTIILIFIRLS